MVSTIGKYQAGTYRAQSTENRDNIIFFATQRSKWWPPPLPAPTPIISLINSDQYYP